MNDLARWQTGNDEYLSAALHWLRLRLQRQVDPAVGTESELSAAAAALSHAESDSTPPALVLLGRLLGLSHFEQEVLLLCAAVELDTRIGPLCAQAQDDPNRPYPTFALALALFDEPAWDVLSPERPLRYWRLLEIHQAGPQPLTTSPLRAEERIVNYLKGLNYLDDRLAALLTPLAGGPLWTSVALPPSQQGNVECILGQLNAAAEQRRLPVIYLLGPDAESKRMIARHLCAELGLHAHRLSVELLPAAAADLETLARLWQRECLLLPVALYLDAHELDRAGPPEHGASTVQRFLSRLHGVCFLDTRDSLPGLDFPVVPIDVVRPTRAEQRAAWATALANDAADSPDLLASQFNLSLAAIGEIAESMRVESADRQRAFHSRLWEACLLRTRPRLDVLAQRLDPRATWADIVLPAPELALLRQIVAQVRQRGTVYEAWGFGRTMNRGLGISVLFAGESGTGKTMAAEVIANDLRLNLYRIDLAAVVSKYIGETEKNLRRLFDAAEDGGAILFFDEADALFGKRSEVKDSHDRYANIEINYLLQRMEAYRGLAILATNMKSALDAAFVRRLRFIVNFPFPGPSERKAIWQRVFPPETPRGEIDFDRLARLNLTGGSIHNIGLNAAFLAAQAESPVTLPLLLDAARTEFRKLERPINEADFRLQPPG